MNFGYFGSVHTCNQLDKCLRTIYFKLCKPSDEWKIRNEFSSYGIESWTKWDYETELQGIVVLKTFEAAFDLLTKGSTVEGVTLHNHWYFDWSWLKKPNPDTDFFNAINENLNDDCICEILNHLDLLHMINFGSMNERFGAILENKLTKLNIRPATVGTIELMNLRYILHLCGDSLRELYISIYSFRSVFGFYSRDRENNVLQTILYFAGESLKQLHLHGFNSIDTETNNSLASRGIQVKMETDSKYNPSLGAVSSFSNCLQKHYL